MDPDEKDLRERELGEQAKGRRTTAMVTLLIAAVVQVVTIVLTVQITGATLDQADDSAEEARMEARNLTALDFDFQRAQYLAAQQRVAYKALLSAARAEHAKALTIQRQFQAATPPTAAETGIERTFDSCRRAVTDVVLLGPGVIEPQARKVGRLCSDLNKSLEARLDGDTNRAEKRTVRQLRRELIDSNARFLEVASQVVQN